MLKWSEEEPEALLAEVTAMVFPPKGRGL